MSDGGDDRKSGDEAHAPKEEKKTSLLEQTTSNQSTSEWFKQYFSSVFDGSDKPKVESRLDAVSFEGIARYIKSDKCKKIVTMAGAGISTSAGIPDFRSPGTGLYDNLQKYNLPHPEALFTIDYFHENPEPFFMLAKQIVGNSYKPTPCHYFIKLLDKKSKLLQHFTQNVDTLERVAGLGEDKLVEAHGSFSNATCLQCGEKYSQSWVEDIIMQPERESPVPYCEKKECKGVVKPDIVLFGESLPQKFADHISDLDNCDMLIVLGTSLVVQPFASLTSRVKEDVPRLYINLENNDSNNDPFSMFLLGPGFAFDEEDNIRDIFWKGSCDDGCYALADLLGWGDELRELVKEGHAKLDKQQKKNTATGASKSPKKTQTVTDNKAKDSKSSAVSKNQSKAEESKESSTKKSQI